MFPAVAFIKFFKLSKGTKQAFKIFSRNFVCFFQGICQNEWGDTYKIRKITLDM